MQAEGICSHNKYATILYSIKPWQEADLRRKTRKSLQKISVYPRSSASNSEMYRSKMLHKINVIGIPMCLLAYCSAWSFAVDAPVR